LTRVKQCIAKYHIAFEMFIARFSCAVFQRRCRMGDTFTSVQ